MKSAPKWLMIPPAVALLLLLGPLAMSGSEGKPRSQPDEPLLAAKPALTRAESDPLAAAGAGRDARDGALPGSMVPRTPDLWQMTSTLVGVLLLGGVGLLGLKKLRGGATPQGAQKIATLRQTMRLGPKQALHAVEFGSRVLLVGESDKGLTLIDSGELPEAAEDEATVLARSQPPAADEDGATPKNLLIPRPDGERQTKPAPSKADVAIAKLNDFRALLQKANS